MSHNDLHCFPPSALGWHQGLACAKCLLFCPLTVLCSCFALLVLFLVFFQLSFHCYVCFDTVSQLKPTVCTARPCKALLMCRTWWHLCLIICHLSDL